MLSRSWFSRRITGVRVVFLLALISAAVFLLAVQFQKPLQVVASGGSAPAAGGAAATSYLVWFRDAAGGDIVTHWVRGAGEQVESPARQPALVMFGQDRLWVIEPRSLAIPLCNCEKFLANDLEGECPPSGKNAAAESLWVRPAAGGEGIALVPYPEADLTTAMGDLDSRIDIVGIVGSYLFLTVGTGGFPCGAAHPSHVVSAMVWDAAGGARVPIESVVEMTAVAKRERQTAYQMLRKRECSFLEKPADTELVALFPVYDPLGRLHVEYLFAGSCCYAASAGEWSSYTQSTRVTAQPLPARLRPFKNTPPAVLAYARSQTGQKMVGWVEIKAGADRKADLFTRFQSALPPATNP